MSDKKKKKKENTAVKTINEKIEKKENTPELENIKKNQLIEYQKIHLGPLPSPEIQAYENACSGAADRIIRMAEEQAKHRQECEKAELKNDQINRDKVIECEIKWRLRGQVLGTVIFIVLVVMGTILISIGKNVGGYISLISAIGGVIGSIYFRKKDEEKREKEEKEEQNPSN